jgi:hypothetical protein
MLKNISKVKGVVSINKTQQKEILGGSLRYCNHRRPCDWPYVCRYGVCRPI